MLESGAPATLEDLAKAKGVAPSYVSQVLRPTLLAPEIVEAILAGKTDQALMLERLERPLPASWAEQRCLIGRSARYALRAPMPRSTVRLPTPARLAPMGKQNQSIASPVASKGAATTSPATGTTRATSAVTLNGSATTPHAVKEVQTSTTAETRTTVPRFGISSEVASFSLLKRFGRFVNGARPRPVPTKPCSHGDEVPR
jgi:hypothetical protein